MKAVEEVLVTFNEMNEANDYFIETMEREELADFIDKAARLAGLEIEEDEDITEEWRDSNEAIHWQTLIKHSDCFHDQSGVG
ncbi:hypothetical protein HW560_30590 [Paenibacillus sp. E222]|nr:hypothetical protein [Paenibacillus sp. OK076]QLG36682.1 hypothetical protein HW560_30590 [Paenibacillus sp. E222]SEM95994.1 hypothetical protein SAMN05518670_0705 [Paenibacillus sp. OK076]